MSHRLYDHALACSGITSAEVTNSHLHRGDVWQARAACAIWWYRRAVPISTIAYWLGVKQGTVRMHVGLIAGDQRKRHGCRDAAALRLAARMERSYVEEPPASAAPPPPATLIEAAAGLVADAYYVRPEEILCPGRQDFMVEARQVLIAVLERQGLSVAAIGRLVGRDHSTVLHHLSYLEALPEDEYLHDLIRELAGELRLLAPREAQSGQAVPAPVQNLFRWLYNALLGQIPRRDRLDVCCYVFTEVLGVRWRQLEAAPARGFVILCRHTAVYSVAICALRLHGRGAHADLLASRLRRMGYRPAVA